MADSLPKGSDKTVALILGRINNMTTTKEEALVLLDKIKVALENKDEKSIAEVCSIIEGRDGKSDSNACERLMGLTETCQTITMEYKTADSNSEQTPEQYITLLEGEVGICNHAYIYVDSDFEGFLDRDVVYLSRMGINTIDIINLSNNETTYTGALDAKIESKFNKDKRDGWLILIGVIIFIGMGILLKRSMR